MLKRFASDEKGATAIEYALIVAIIALVALSGITGLSTSLKSNYQNTAMEVNAVSQR